MSFVTAVITESSVFVTTDGRSRKNGIIVNENAVKHVLPKKDLVIAYTGVKEACEEALKLSGINYAHDSLELITSKLSNRLTDRVYFEVKLSFIIAGRNAKGRNQLSVVSNFHANQHLIPANERDMKISFSGSDQLILHGDKYRKAISEFEKELSQLQNPILIPGIQTRFNNRIADFDESVNRNVQYIMF